MSKTTYIGVNGTCHKIKKCYIGIDGVAHQVRKIYVGDDSVAKLVFELNQPVTEQIRYVSLGDSIAAGHTINADWETNYGEGSQYGKNGNTSTTIVPECYTELIYNELVSMYGTDNVVATSFARSGDTVADLMSKLSHTVVVEEIAKADIVTICIGANDVLQPALSHLDEYINTGSMSAIESTIENNLAVLSDDSNANSYVALINKLNDINPNAQYVFTTVYNPYKYLWIEEGHHGFFGPLINTIPDIEILGLDVDSLIKDSLLGTPVVQQLFSRVNGLSAWAEKYVTKLNNVLRSKITAYANDNFLLADTKAVYDPIPDRPITSPKHYNDLVSVEYTRGYDTMTMDWGRLYENSGDAGTFWMNLATKYVSLSGIDINGFASELVQQIIEKVIMPDVDPHPEWYGHHALKCSFVDALGWTALPRRTIVFNANGSIGSMESQVIVSLDNMTTYMNIVAHEFTPVTGYYFTGWNTESNGSGTSYSVGQFVGITGDMTLYAQWSNIYTVTFRHSEDSTLHGSSDTGPMECYALWIDGTEQSDLGAFSNSARTYQLPYGASVGVIAAVKSGSDRSYVTFNGTKVAGNSSDARYGFTVTSHTDIHFEWNYFLDGLSPQSYWNCYITTY